MVTDNVPHKIFKHCESYVNVTKLWSYNIIVGSWIGFFVIIMVENKEFPFEIEVLDPQKSDELAEFYVRGSKTDFIRIGPKKYFLPKEYLSIATDIYNLPLRSDDTFVITYPKSGTTLSQELVWLICNNLDYEKAASTVLNERYPFIEVSIIVPTDEKSYLPEDRRELMRKTLQPVTMKEITEMPSPRFIKTHLAMSLLPPSLLDKAKVVYMMRDPRDVAVSYYHHHKFLKRMKPVKEFKPFWNNLVSDNMYWAPYFKHVLEAWEKRNHPNMLFLVYEETIKDMPAAIRRVANFFGKTFSDEQVQKLAQHLAFDNFKKNKSVNMENLKQSGSEGAFIRKGQPGEWREYFDDEMTAQANEWIEKNLRDTDFRLPNCL